MHRFHAEKFNAFGHLSNTTYATCSLKKSEKIRMHDVKSAISLTLLNDTRDINLTSTCAKCE